MRSRLGSLSIWGIFGICVGVQFGPFGVHVGVHVVESMMRSGSDFGFRFPRDQISSNNKALGPIRMENKTKRRGLMMFEKL